jgi:hypothetical protein
MLSLPEKYLQSVGREMIGEPHNDYSFWYGFYRNQVKYYANSDKFIGIGKLTEYTNNGPVDINLETFLDRFGSHYSIKALAESADTFYNTSAAGRVMKQYIQKRQMDLMRAWTEE